MIKSKHIVITKFNGEEPRQHFREATVADFTQYSYKGYGQAVEEPFSLTRRPQLYPISWGWNADGRSGNATAVEITSPQIVHKSTQRNYIQGDAGTHHSLLVAENGMVYSYGNGRKGQLGYRNEYMAQAGVRGPKGGIQQTCPRAVTPSGNLLFGTDIKVVQVAAGRFFSVSRQMSVDEGVASVEGLMQSEKALRAMLVRFPDSPALLKAWSEVRQEKCKVARISGGQLLTWGSGGKGELGHGIYYQYEPKPRIIERLRNVSIIQVSAGRHHCLAISSTYQLYSWGSGRSGKLGHGNFEDVHSPEFVQFFDKYYVEACSAGDNHSAVLTRTKRGDRDSQLRRVACFGKGAHGRLGNGRNLMKCDPVLVDQWPPSLKGVQIHAIACGGAHTLALCYRSVKRGLANPWGRETYLAAWGYGANGQLGTGYLADSFVPVKVRMPERCVLICEISAGKSWSMARSIGGELFTWGKGLRGQLGHGGKFANRFRIVPTKVKTFASFVGLSAGHGHNVCISTPKKQYSPRLSIAAAKYSDPFDNPVSLTLKPTESESQFRFNCCKRHIHPVRARLRFMCKECNIQSICVVCMRQCHRGHTITERLPVERSAQVAAAEAALKKRKVKVHVDNARQAELKEQRRITKKGKKKKKKKQKEEKPSLISIKSSITTKEYRQKQRALQRAKIPFCCCGMYNSKCCLLPSIPEEQAALLGGDGELNPKTERLKNFGLLSSLPLDVRRQQAAIRIQRQAQWYIGRKNIQKLRRDLMDLRRIVCTRHWNKTILEPIWDKLERARARFREEREREEMEIEYDFKKKYDYLFGLQIALGSCNGMNYAMERWIGGLSIQVPRVIRREVATDAENILPSHAFSWASVRHQQLQLHPKKRLSVKVLADLTRYVPREFKNEGKPRDIDLLAYTQRFLQDIRSMQWRAAVNARIQAKIQARQKALAGARAALLQVKLGGSAAIAKADALLGKGPKAPVESLSRAEQAAETLRERAEALRLLDKKVEAALRADREEFDMYAEPKRQHLSIRRRNSIGNPKGMHKRVLALRESLPQQASSRRRNSLPANMKDLYPEQAANYPSYAGSKKSLELFHTRIQLLAEYVSPEHSNMWNQMQERTKNKRLKRLFSYAWLNPRLPAEMRAMLQGSSRRRTIADPERLAAQMHVMFEARNFFAQGRAKVAEVEKLRVRRRSFDLGEFKDEEDKISSALGYEFEEPFKQPTLSELRRDSSLMENRMIFAGVAKTNTKDPKKARPDFSGFQQKETLQQRIDREVREADEKKGAADSSLSRFEKAQQAAAHKPRMGRSVKNSSSNKKQLADSDFGEDGAQSHAVIWHEYFSDLGETYYYNAVTGESSWEFPAGQAQVLSQYQDDEGNYYWYNWTTGETQWA